MMNFFILSCVGATAEGEQCELGLVLREQKQRATDANKVCSSIVITKDPATPMTLWGISTDNGVLWSSTRPRKTQYK